MNVMDQDRSQTKMRPISSFVFLILVLLCFPEANNAIKDDADRAWLQLETDPTGTFFIRLKSTSSNDIWAELHSAETRVGPYSSSEGSLLRLGPPIAIDGEDVFGIYEGMSWGWATKDDPNTLQLVTSIYSYPSDDPELLIFEQHFPKAMTFTDIQKASEQNLSSLSLFPSFRRNPGPTDALKTFSYHGVFPKIQHGNFSNYQESHQGGVPLVLYNKSSPSLPMLVFSPLTWVKASHMASSHALVGAGVKSTVDYIPAGWTQWFLLSASSRGINQGMMEWGDRMLKYNGIQERDNPYQYRDEVHSTIGFWTDNGGYYHYALGNVSRGSTYEDVLPQVKAYHDSIGVPFGHWQFDSWFYPKGM